jgi:Trk K+ transport system NAD-binding subunit
VLVVGGGRVGRRLSTRLAAARPVHHLDTDPTVVAGPTPHEATHVPDLAAPATLGMAAEGGELAVVLTGEDGRNLLVTQQLRLRIGLERVIVVLADPRNRDVFDLPGVETICAGATLVDAVASSLDTDPVVPS